MASDRASHGQPVTRVPLIIAVTLAVVAVIGQTITLTAEDDDTFGAGMFVLLAVNAIIGLVAAFRFDPFPAGSSTDRRVAAATSRAAGSAFAIIGVAVAVQIVLGILQAIVIIAVDGRDDWTEAFSPFLFAGLVGTGGALGGLLVGLLVVWPIIKLIQSLTRIATGKKVVPGAAPLSLILLATVAAAIFTVLAPNSETSGTPRGRGLSLIVGVWFDYSGDTRDQVFAWVARALQLVIAGAVVWLVLDQRAQKKRGTPE